MIKVYRSRLEIEDYNWKSCPSLEYMFAVWNFMTYQYDYLGIHWDPTRRVLYLPRGMEIHKVERLLRRRLVIMKEYDKWESTGPVMLKYLPKNDVQDEYIT